MTASPVTETPTVSLRARIAALDVGKTVSEASRLTGADAKEIEDEIERMRNVVNPQVARAKAQTGHGFTIEQGSFLSRSRDLLIIFAITRIN